MKTYTKHPLSIEDQIAKLKFLGLVIADETNAKKVLGEVNYQRNGSKTFSDCNGTQTRMSSPFGAEDEGKIRSTDWASSKLFLCNVMEELKVLKKGQK